MIKELQSFHLVILKLICLIERVEIAYRKNNWCHFKAGRLKVRMSYMRDIVLQYQYQGAGIGIALLEVKNHL